jgi:urate oxidase
MVAHVRAGIKDLLGTLPLFNSCPKPNRASTPVLKSTGSAFNSFIRDEYTTLVEVDDRIFSTAVDVSYTFAPFNIPTPVDEKKLEFSVPADAPRGGIWDPDVPTRARDITMNVFAEDESASVQVGFILLSEFRWASLIHSCVGNAI